MEIFLKIFGTLGLLSFWAAVLAFVPTTFYLLVKNPPISKAERINSEWIYILSQEDDVKKARNSRIWTVLLIYLVCFIVLLIAYVVNLQRNSSGVWPFDILSSLSVIFFWFSVVSYLPVVAYLTLKNPWKKQEDGPCLNGIFIGYGIAILVFSVAFALLWMKRHGVSIGLIEVGAPIVYMLFSSVVVAYLPILAYVLMKQGKVFRSRIIHANIIFIIYSLSFLTSSVVYVISWIAVRRVGNLSPF